MGKCVKNIFLSVIMAAVSVFALSSPVFATPDTTTPATPNTSVTTKPDDNSTDSDNNSTDSANTDNANNSTENTENTENTATNAETAPSCYDQVGNLGWIICPGAGLFGNIIDGAYGLLTSIIEVNPLPTDNSSPVYIVWEYFRNITNIIFIIFFLIVIFSQLTGVGINNYGIKRTLPRIIIAAILVNLSYIVCTIAVDISNILGNNFQGFFTNIQNIAIQNGTVASAAAESSVSGVVAAMLGIGTAAGATAIAATALGGIGGVIWILLPVLLGGLIAVISAIVTMAARQALIFLLVMISPLAFVAYMLPNTEKWFTKWYSMIFRMLIFYPMFSILYGASQLAGLVIITSATNWLGVVLGIAVKILPLFMSIPLMRMSGTALGKIDGVVRRMSSPAYGAVGRASAERRVHARNKQLNSRRALLPSTRLAQFLDNQKASRELRSSHNAEMTKERRETYAWEKLRRRDGTYNKHGVQFYDDGRRKMDYATQRLEIQTYFDDGFKTDGTDARIRNRDAKKVETINKAYETAIVSDAVAKSRQRVVAHNNMKNRAQLIYDHANVEGDNVRQHLLSDYGINEETFNTINTKKKAYDAAAAKQASGQTLTAAEQATLRTGQLTDAEMRVYTSGHQAINFTLADAIAARRKLNKDAQAIYYELYDDSPAGTIPGTALTESLNSGDHNSMSAAIAVMAKRGDHKDIMEILQANSQKIVGNTEDKIRFQKEINDACLALKADNPVLWAWAKANMIRRGKYNGALAEGKTEAEIKLQPFIDFDHFINGSLMDGEVYDTRMDDEGHYINLKDAEEYNMIAMDKILTNVRDGKIFAGADRTMYNFFLKAGKKGKLTKEKGQYLFADVKHLRNSACSGMMDGEQLAAFNNYMTYGFVPGGNEEDNAFFEEHREDVKELLEEYFRDMTAGQLASVKTATLTQFNDALIELNHDAVTNKNGKVVSKTILDLLENQIDQLNRPNMVHQRAGMNQAVRQMLEIDISK